jgi:hypothetical protein
MEQWYVCTHDFILFDISSRSDMLSYYAMVEYTQFNTHDRLRKRMN